MNVYRYVNNDPVNLIDTEGHFGLDAIFIPSFFPVVAAAGVALGTAIIIDAVVQSNNSNRNNNRVNPETPLGQSPRNSGPTPSEIAIGLGLAAARDKCSKD